VELDPTPKGPYTPRQAEMINKEYLVKRGFRFRT